MDKKLKQQSSSNQHDLFDGFILPQSNNQEVLLSLILNGSTTFHDFAYMQGYRTRVSDLTLKYGLMLHEVNHKERNKFKRQYIYVQHILPESEKEKAIALYKKLNKGYHGKQTVDKR